jgi:molybdenum cofactor guanylyltransferase
MFFERVLQPPFPEVASLILAGGQSRRMGQDKALVTWQGQPLLQRVYEVAVACTPQVYLLSPWPERYQDCLPQAEFLLEATPEAGPLVALAQALEQISADWLLLLPCDMPRLDPEILTTWQQQLVDQPSHVRALIPRHANGQWEPLCGFYRLQPLPHQAPLQKLIQDYIQQGGRSFQAWLSQLPAQPLAVTPTVATMLWNCNTPQDLAEPPEEPGCD